MTQESPAPAAKDTLTKMGDIGFLLDVIGLALVILTWIFCFVLPFVAGVLPDIPPLRIGLMVLTAVVLIAAFILETISSLKNKEKTWKVLAGFVIWLLAAAGLAVLTKILLF